MAVAINNDHIARCGQRLHRHLVGGGGTIGHEEHMIRTKGARGHFLRAFDIAGGLQQAIKPACRGAAFRQEQVDAVEFAHVANPIGPEHGFPARNRQRMKGADRAHGVFFQIVEEGRFIAFLHAFQNGQMLFQQFLNTIEDAPNAARGRIAGQDFHILIGHQIDIQFGPEALQARRQLQGRFLW